MLSAVSTISRIGFGIFSLSLAVYGLPTPSEESPTNQLTQFREVSTSLASDGPGFSPIFHSDAHRKLEIIKEHGRHQLDVRLLASESLGAQTAPSPETSYCGNSTVDPVPACWDKLQVTQYLEDWWAKHANECNEEPYVGQGFAQCYQQKVGNGMFLLSDCSNISIHCEAPDFLNFTHQEFYVLYSIFGIWSWYNSVWIAIGDAAFLSDLSAGSIVRTINPIHPGDTSLGQLFSALAAGFAFLSFPAGQVGTAGAKLAATAVGQAPGLVKALLPTGTLDSEFTQLSSIEDGLKIVVESFRDKLSNVLRSTLNDKDMFSSFAANGSFMVKAPSLNASTNNLTRVLSTYIVSQALQANNIIVTVAENTYPYNLTHGLNPYKAYEPLNDQYRPETVFCQGSTDEHGYCEPSQYKMLPQNAWHVNCQDPPNDDGVCDNWWYDAEGGGAYALFNLGDIGKNYYELMNTMFSKGWTSGRELFLGAKECAETSQDYAPSLAIDLVSGKAACSSNLRYCPWNQTNDLRSRDGKEFERLRYSGCFYAWPDACDSIGHYPYRFTESVRGLLLGWTSTNITNVKDCHNLDKDYTFAWGGVGYHRTAGTECYPYPASYLGPGLALDTELCVPEWAKDKGS
ncbi:MAG: hypothetical protein M1836_006070 [Candelina mexicana]|nr:MAG: hypothetical protein M1836_006070 [Candelina mexicana]